MREAKTCFSDRLQTPTAFGMILAVRSFVIRTTEQTGIRTCQSNKRNCLSSTQGLITVMEHMNAGGAYETLTTKAGVDIDST